MVEGMESSVCMLQCLYTPPCQPQPSALARLQHPLVSSRPQVILTRAARGLIAGSSANSRGLEGRQAALLYFDELQITDPFTAVSLKGAGTPNCLASVQTITFCHIVRRYLRCF